MPIKINFDTAHNPEFPTLVLATRNGTKLGGINARNVILKDSSASELSFKVNKFVDGKEDYLWDKIKNFKLVWCKEWDTWFEIYVEIDETDNTQKIVSGVRLGVAELSQIVLYGIQINTEDDIAREDYVPTVLFDNFTPEGSLLHRIMREKAQHYEIIHVDASIANIQRTFQFDGVSIYDAFQEIGEEIGCVFVLHSNSGKNGEIARTISVYDAHSICKNCGYRGDFIDVCPECGSTDVSNTYGEDTTIFITSDDLTDDIQFTSDTDSIKNCFKLEGGDDLMTATIRNCNPNGTDTIWRFNEDTFEDMRPELVERIKSYDELYNHYQKEYVVPLDESMVNQYNDLVDKYLAYNPELEKIEPPVTGYPELMNVYYNIIDLNGYLQTSMMPDTSLSDTNADEQAKLLTRTNLSPVAVANIEIISSATADSSVLAMAKSIIDARYQVKIKESSLNVHQWTGNFVVTNYSDKEDTAESATISLEITGDFKEFVEQKIYKAMAKSNTEDVSITGLFSLEYEKFCAELKKYALDNLGRFKNCCQGCLDVMIEQGIADESAWKTQSQNLYDDLYVPYYQKMQAIEAEMSIRQAEIDSITGTHDENGGVLKEGLLTQVEEFKETIQETLDFKKYLGDDLWLEFCSYRRDDKYSNSNFISDGLSNAEIFKRALEFIELANEELYRSSELQHSISISSLMNLLILDKFKPLAEHFEIGNWMRVLVDGTVYKLRLVDYEIDYDNIESISVTFSDVIKTSDGLSAVQSAVSQMQSMSSSYDYYQRQASQGANGNKYIKTWFEDGLDVTNMMIVNNADGQVQTWDEHGMLFRAYDPITETYDNIQMKIINSTLVVTDDDWEHVKTAIGLFYYEDPVDGKLKTAYGVNAEMVIGKMILGQGLGLYNESNSLTFNQNGLEITNGTNTFTVNPNDAKLLKLSKDNEDILWVDENGVLHICGDGAGLDIQANDFIQNMETRITQNAESIKAEAERAGKAEADLELRADSITSTVTNLETNTHSWIQQSADGLRGEFEKADEGLKASIEATNDSIKAEAERAGKAEAALELRADSITTSVEDLETNTHTWIEQSASGLRGEFEKADEGLKASIEATAESITSTVTDLEANTHTWIEQSANDITASVNTTLESYSTTEEIQAMISAMEGSITLSVTSTLSNYYTQEDVDGLLESYVSETTYSAQIQLLSDSITSKVSKSDLSGEVSSQIEQNADSIRLRASKIQWEADNSSLSQDGVLYVKDSYQIYRADKNKRMNVISTHDSDATNGSVNGLRMGLHTSDYSDVVGGYISCKWINPTSSGSYTDSEIYIVSPNVYIGRAKRGSLACGRLFVGRNESDYYLSEGEIAAIRVNTNDIFLPDSGAYGSIFDIFAKIGHTHDIDTVPYAEKAHYVCAANNGTSVAVGIVGAFRPDANGGASLGNGSYKWTTVYAQTGAIDTSDRRLKENIREFDETYEQVFMELKPSMYNFRNVKETDNHDRTHYGFIAQDVEATLEKYGLTSMDCSALCKDYVSDFDGENTYADYGIDDCVYSFRYEEIIPLNTHMIQKALKHQQEQDATIAQLVEMNSMLLDRISKLEKQNIE